MAGSSSSKIATLIVLVPLALLAWYLAPMALPVWRWRNMDFREQSKKLNIPEAMLKKEFDMRVRFHPRGDGDPFPFQLISMDPTWLSADEKTHNDEDHLMVRCTLISDRSGNPPSSLFLGSTYKDRYFKTHGWRFPPGAFGLDKRRPVVIYQGDTFDKLSIGDAEVLDTEVNYGAGKWTNDDKDPDDGFAAPH
ncbi:MAG: hypothetical protein H0W83_15780 [Planctomycetes bacterium]|nr:hypothetical protein [Planctomycetota bacterium]